jgi:hypothetical protein
VVCDDESVPDVKARLVEEFGMAAAPFAGEPSSSLNLVIGTASRASIAAAAGR